RGEAGAPGRLRGPGSLRRGRRVAEQLVPRVRRVTARLARAGPDPQPRAPVVPPPFERPPFRRRSVRLDEDAAAPVDALADRRPEQPQVLPQRPVGEMDALAPRGAALHGLDLPAERIREDRKSTRLNSSHVKISYAA